MEYPAFYHLLSYLWLGYGLSIRAWPLTNSRRSYGSHEDFIDES